MPQDLAIYEDLSALDNLNYWGAAYGIGGQELKSRVAFVLERIGLQDRAKDLPKNYSGRMKRRLNFGCGLVHEPKSAVGKILRRKIKAKFWQQTDRAIRRLLSGACHISQAGSWACPQVSISGYKTFRSSVIPSTVPYSNNMDSKHSA